MNTPPLFEAVPPAQNAKRPVGLTVWSQATYDLLQTLAIRVRLLRLSDLPQILGTEMRPARRVLIRLAEAGLIRRYVINAHPLPAVHRPLFAWQTGQPAPDPRAVSSKARARWDQLPRPVEVCAASKQTANLFGGTAHGLPPLEQRDHDLLLGRVYCHYRCRRRNDARCWLGEDHLPKAGYRLKDPDAFLVDVKGLPYRVIESAGRYGPKQIQSFHDYCHSHSLPYELW